MRINLDCPYSDKDRAKQLGARWCAVQRVWYVTSTDNIAEIKQWLPKTITLAEYLAIKYSASSASLSKTAAQAFGVPFPLETGWIKMYRYSRAPASILDHKPAKKRNRSSKIEGGSTQIQASDVTTITTPASCACTALPWEHCEHTRP